jgi:VanZ family protein
MVTDNTRRRLIVAARVVLAVSMVVIMHEATAKHPDEVPVVRSDKLLHGLAFCWLAFLADIAFPLRGFGLRKIVPLFAYGVAIEFVQSFLPWRSTEVADIFADGAGLVVYALLAPLLRRFSPLRDRWFGSVGELEPLIDRS